MPAIFTESLNRSYKTYKKPQGLRSSLIGFFNRQYEVREALKPTELSIERGQIIGLVGSNGAGKTTLLKLLSGLIYPSSGRAEVLGYIPWERKPAFLKKMSILLGQKSQLWWDLPAADSFELLSRIYELDLPKTQRRARELAELLKCDTLLHVQLRRLSLGERMKMEIIGSLLHQPEILFLDEPTIGLDIVAQSTIREFIQSYRKEHNPTIILTSHYMDDISQLADRLLLISKGSIVYDGAMNEFLDAAELKQKLTLKLDRPLAHDFVLNSANTFTAGTQILQVRTESHELGTTLKRILDISSVQDIKIEETDFEDVIRDFLEKDLGASKARHSLST